jgi:AcrR family transcriptional regulator
LNIRPDTTGNPNAKQAVIMEAMTGLVHQYGYSKITMDDIAKASGLSRPALYQFFKNKQEIYRAIASHMCRESLQVMQDALSGDGAPQERLVRAIVDGKLKMLCEMEATQHGSELLDLGNELSTDIIEAFSTGMVSLITGLFTEVNTGEGFAKPESMAINLVFWLEGMKAQVKEPAEREALLRNYVAMQFAALRAG